MATRRLLLVGGGHAHVEVLRRFALRRLDGVEVAVVSPDPLAAYSGMLPGLVAGHYAPSDIHIALPPLAGRAGAAFVADRVVGLDMRRREAARDKGAPLPFDLLSIDVGSTPAMTVEGVRQHAVPVKPIDAFLAAWNATLATACGGNVRSIAVVGGLGACELALAMRHRLHAMDIVPAMHVVTERWNVAPGLARLLGRLLARRGIAHRTGRSVHRIDAAGVVLDDGETIEAERVFWAVGGAPAPWLAASGLACDEQGFVRIGDTLQSVSHADVFAAGDCATQDGHPHPRSGVYAVRQGPVLAENLRGRILGDALRRYEPQRRTLALVATGDRRAIGTYGSFTFAGALAWRWKDRIDRGFVARYREASLR